MEGKQCVDCGVVKPISEFRHHWNSPDGYTKRCSACREAAGICNQETYRKWQHERLAAEEAERVEGERVGRFVRFIQQKRRERLYPFGQIIYALLDPRTEATRYIGRTYEPGERRNTHNRGRTANRAKNEWVLELRKMGHEPIMQELEIVAPEEFVLERELRWIYTHIHSGSDLLNAETRNPDIVQAVLNSPCQDFFTEPRESKLLRAIPGWSRILMAGDDWGHRLALGTAMDWTVKLDPAEVPAEFEDLYREWRSHFAQ